MSSIYLIFLLCPIYFSNFIAQGLGFEKMILLFFLVLIGVVSWVTKGVVLGELELKRTPLDWPILALVFFFAISTALSINSTDSLIGSYGNITKGFSALIIFSLFYYLLVNNLSKIKIKIIFWIIIFSASLLIVFSLLQLLELFILPFVFTSLKTFNPIGSLTGLTMAIIIYLPILIVALAQVKEFHPKINKIGLYSLKVALTSIIICGLAVLVLLNGFTFWPAAIVGIVVILMFFLSKIVPISNNNIIIPLVSFLIFIILFVFGSFNLYNMSLPAEVSLSRQASWNIAKNSLFKDPLFGSGPSTFYYNFSKYKGNDFNSSPLWNIEFDNASGVIFELLSTVGILGTLSILIVFLIAFSLIFLALIKSKPSPEISILLSLFASFITIVIYAVLFSLNNSVIIISMLLLIMAASVSVVIYPEKFKSLNLSFRSSPKYALALAAVFLAVSAGVVILFTMGIKMYIADSFAKMAMFSNDTDKKLEYASKAVGLFPYQDRYYVDLSNNYIVLANQQANSGGDADKIQNYLSLAIDNGKKAVDLAPNKKSNNESLALIYENASFFTKGALEWSESLYNKVTELSPDNPLPYLRIGLINMARANNQKDPEEQKFYINEAIKNYDKALEKKNDFSSAFYGKAVAYEKLTNNDEAIEQLKKAVISDRNNIDYRFELGRMLFNRAVAQPSLTQNASADLTEGQAEEGELSVEPSQEVNTNDIKNNEDLITAEQIFFSILQLNPNHANSLYSLAMIYQKTGENEKAGQVVKKLLEVVTDEETRNVIRQQFNGLY
jgi:tetratricopeptide (TPR) repeat protein